MPLPTLAADAAPEVARAQFTTEVANREPVDALYTLGTDRTQVYFFTDLRNLSGHTVTHRWMYLGDVMAEVSFNVGGDRWRVWSSKQLDPGWRGDWNVVVVDDSGKVLHEDTLIYGD